MVAVKASLAVCFLLLFMPIFFSTSCGKKAACEEWMSVTYRMLIWCSSKKCNRYCVAEGATRGDCGFLIARSFCFCARECD